MLHHSVFHGLRRPTSGRVSVISTIHRHSEKYQTLTVPLQCPELCHLCVYSNSQPYCVLLPMINKRQAEAQEKFMFQTLTIAQWAPELMGRVAMRTHLHRGDLKLCLYIFLVLLPFWGTYTSFIMTKLTDIYILPVTMSTLFWNTDLEKVWLDYWSDCFPNSNHVFISLSHQCRFPCSSSRLP